MELVKYQLCLQEYPYSPFTSLHFNFVLPGPLRLSMMLDFVDCLYYLYLLSIDFFHPITLYCLYNLLVLQHFICGFCGMQSWDSSIALETPVRHGWRATLGWSGETMSCPNPLIAHN